MVLGINPARNRPQTIEKQKVDPVDRDMGRIMKALQIANQGFQLVGEFTTSDAEQLAMDADNAKIKREQAQTAKIGQESLLLGKDIQEKGLEIEALPAKLKTEEISRTQDIKNAEQQEKLDAVKVKKIEAELLKMNSEGQLNPGDIGLTDAGTPQNSAQLKSEGVATRLEYNTGKLNELDINTISTRPGVQRFIETMNKTGKVPFVGDSVQAVLSGIGMDPATVLNSEEKRYLAHSTDWLRTWTRHKSGAVIGEKEIVDEYSDFFPVAGDDAAAIEAKAQIRQEAERSIIIETGRIMKRNPIAMDSKRSSAEPITGSILPGQNRNVQPKKIPEKLKLENVGKEFYQDVEKWVEGFL